MLLRIKLLSENTASESHNSLEKGLIPEPWGLLALKPYEALAKARIDYR